MNDEFDKIIDLFSLKTEEKEKKLDDIFHLSMQFIEKYQYIQHEGSSEEKEDVTKKLSILREKISAEAKQAETSIDLSKEEIKKLSNDEKNFTEDQWKLLQKTKKTLEIEKAKLKAKKEASFKKDLHNIASPAKKKKKTKRGKSSWLKS